MKRRRHNCPPGSITRTFLAVFASPGNNRKEEQAAAGRDKLHTFGESRMTFTSSSWALLSGGNGSNRQKLQRIHLGVEMVLADESSPSIKERKSLRENLNLCRCLTRRWKVMLFPSCPRTVWQRKTSYWRFSGIFFLRLPLFFLEEPPSRRTSSLSVTSRWMVPP